MVLTSSQHNRLLRWVQRIAIASIILGILFRFTALDQKVYWHDEAYTSMVITARPGRYLSQDLFQNQVVQPADLLAYQNFVPGLSLQDMVVRKGVEDVQHPPLYYILLRFWAQLWGTEPAVIRGFSAALSLLLLPALYGLCWELFQAPLAGWVALALFAVSPFHLVYGQEAREFGLWTALALISSGLLLRAFSTHSWRNWVLYGLSLVVAFYTALFSLPVAVGHFVYVLLLDPENHIFSWPLRVGKRTVCFGTTLIGVGLLYSPWMSFIVASRNALGATTSWTSIALPPLISTQLTALNFSRGFVDFNFDLSNPWAYVLAIPVLMVQGYALFVLVSTASPRIRWFILTLIGSTALFWGLPDLFWGGQRFTVTRYLIPCVVGLQLAVVYLLVYCFTHPKPWKSRLAISVFSLLMLAGVLSCGVYSQADTWWNKEINSNYHQVADLMNGRDRTLIIADAYGYNPTSVVSLSYLLKPESQLWLLPPVGESFPSQPLPTGVQTIFLFNLPAIFRQQFEIRYRIELMPVFQDPWNEVWKGIVPTRDSPQK